MYVIIYDQLGFGYNANSPDNIYDSFLFVPDLFLLQEIIITELIM